MILFGFLRPLSFLLRQRRIRLWRKFFLQLYRTGYGKTGTLSVFPSTQNADRIYHFYISLLFPVM